MDKLILQVNSKKLLRNQIEKETFLYQIVLLNYLKRLKIDIEVIIEKNLKEFPHY